MGTQEVRLNRVSAINICWLLFFVFLFVCLVLLLFFFHSSLLLSSLLYSNARFDNRTLLNIHEITFSYSLNTCRKKKTFLHKIQDMTMLVSYLCSFPAFSAQ